MGKLEGYVEIEGLRVANILRSKQEAEDFNAAVMQAMQLLKEYSPISYGRVRRYTNKVHNGKTGYLAVFNWPSYICTVDFPWLVREHPDVVESLAAILVHESIHGLLWSKGIQTTVENRNDVVLACERMEDRFWNWLDNRELMNRFGENKQMIE
ncbi:MAG: hypothetical protein V4710_16795 [Verrucomicrobiota bacterium]